MRTSAEHVAVGQEAPVHRRPHLAHGAFFDQAAGIEPFVEMPGQCMVLPAGRAAEVIERQAEAAIDVGLDRMLRIAVVPHVLAGLDRTELRRCTVLVGAADEQYLVAELAAETRMHIRGQKRADEIAEVLDAVDVGQRAGDQNLAHDTSVRVRSADPETKALPHQRKGSGSRRMPRAIGRASTLPAGPVAVGPAHLRRVIEVRHGHAVLTTVSVRSRAAIVSSIHSATGPLSSTPLPSGSCR